MGALVTSWPAVSQNLVGRGLTTPDLSGEWLWQVDEDAGQPPYGDYLGIPFNSAGRLRADTTAESLWGTPEFRCRPHSLPHQWRGIGGARFIKELDPLSRVPVAYHVQFWRSLDRPIYLDGRPHPPAFAPHSWTGFSTGEWVGDTLVVTTTHIKDGYLKRGGPQTSDMYTLTEYLTRHDEFLTITQIVDDPIYLDEPYVQTTNYALDIDSAVTLESCATSALGDMGGDDPHFVPHFLPDENPYVTDWLEDQDWIPEEAARGGAETLYPGYVPGGNNRRRDFPVSQSAVDANARIAAQAPRDGNVHVLPVQGNVFMLVADGTNITASVGPDGVMLVNTGSGEMTDKVFEAVQDLATRVAANPRPNDCMGAQCRHFPYGWASPSINSVIASPAPARPIRYIVNTSSAEKHTAGNARLAAAGAFQRRSGTNMIGAPSNASIIAHEDVLIAMSALDRPGGELPPEAWPTDTYFYRFQKLSEYFNGEGVVIYHEPAANTSGDSIVQFRQSEVISAGDIFSTVSYPFIDVEAGGTIEGVLDGLNHIIDLAVAEYRSQGGTWIIPSHGRLADVADVASYRNMVTMIRDRIESLKARGMTLEQVLAAEPTRDFDGRYDTYDDTWTARQFVTAVYQTLE
jgi:hypothetical protein